MALLFFDGFDHYGNGADLAAMGKWGAGGYFNPVTSPTPRTGTHCLQGNSAADITTKALPASGGVIVGVAIHNANGTFSDSDYLFKIYEGGIVHLSVGVRTGSGAAKLAVFLGTGTLLATGAKPLSANNWYYIEFKATIHGSTGSYELRIDGLPELTATNINTQNGGTGQWTNVQMRSFTTSTNSRYDDFYVCDTSGPAPWNTFLGLVKIETLYPQTDAVAAGSNAGLVPSSGTDHGALVDEMPPNTTDYNSSATVGAKDTYQYPPMTLAGVVLGIQTNLYTQKSDAAAREVCSVLRVGGTDYDGPNVPPLTSFAYQSTVHSVNPATGLAWTTADVAALEAGMKVTV